MSRKLFCWPDAVRVVSSWPRWTQPTLPPAVRTRNQSVWRSSMSICSPRPATKKIG
jgi:hypothetical protein